MAEARMIEMMARAIARRTPAPVSWMTREEWVDRTWFQNVTLARELYEIVSAAASDSESMSDNSARGIDA